VPNPFKGRPSIPDTILQTPDLTPQAQVVGAQYAKPTVRNVAQVPTTNTLEQLAAGLAELNPALQQYAGRLGEKYSEEEKAGGLEAARKAGVPLAEAVRLKQLAPGASPQFQDSYQTEIVRQRGQKYAASQYEAWSKRQDIHESDDSRLMTQFLSDHKAEFDQANLTNADGTPTFTPRQLKLGGYATSQEEADATLTRHNADLRINARTAKGIDTFTAGVQQILTQGTTGLDGQPRPEHEMDYPVMAKKADDLMRTALATGLSTAQATDILAHGAHQAAIEQLNPQISREFGAAVDAMRSKDAPLTGTAKWVTYNQTSREHISAQLHSQLVAQTFLEDQAVLGTPAERIARKQGAVASADAKSDYARQELRQKELDQAHTDNVFDFPDLHAMSPANIKEQDRRLSIARLDSPAHAAVLGEQVMKQREHRADLGDKETFPQTEMKLRAEITQHPGSTQTSGMIDQAMRDHTIGVEGWLRSHELNKTMGQADLKYHKFLSDPGYTVLESGVGKASLKDETALFGTENIAETMARSDFRQQAVNYLDHTPNPSMAVFLQEMRKHVEPTAFNYNPMAKEENQRLTKEKAKQQAIIDLALKDSDVTAIQSHTKINRQKNSHGEYFRQGPDEELQVMKAQAQTELIQRQDAENAKNAAGILKEGHDAARRFNGKPTQAEADSQERAAIRAELDRRFPHRSEADRAAGTETIFSQRHPK